MDRSAATGPRMLVGVVIGVTTVIALMLLAFAAPAMNSGPRALPLALSGPEQATAPIMAALQESQPDAFEITTHATAEDAAEAIRDRQAIGGVAVDAGGVTIQTASGAGAPYAGLLQGIGGALSVQGQQVTYVDLAPMSEDDPAGTGLATLGLPLIFGGLASAAALALVYRGPVLHRVLTALVLSVVAGYVATAILQFGFGSFDGSFWLIGLAVSAGIAAVSLTGLGLGLVMGPAGVGLAALLMLFVANPLAGLATGPQWLPQPWGQIGQYLPLGAAGTTVRSAAYFDGHGATTAWIVLACWALAGLALALVGARRHTTASGRTAASAPTPATGRA